MDPYNTLCCHISWPRCGVRPCFWPVSGYAPMGRGGLPGLSDARRGPVGAR